MLTPEEIDTLRKEAKKLMIDLDLDVRKRGALSCLAYDLSAKTGRKISRNTLSMALSGYRSTENYQSIIKEFHSMLAEKITAQGVFIHEGEKKTINL